MLLLNPLVLAAALAALCAAVLLRALRSPLRRVPGPVLSLFTPAALRWHELHANRTRYVHALHRRYGPVVRLGPSEVAFASAAAIREIYCSGGSGYDKTEFYDLFKIYGRRTMFATLNKEDHARRRRILADRYANSNVMRQPSVQGLEERSHNFLKRCQDSVGGSLDLYAVNLPPLALHAYAFDCVTHHLFHPYGVNSLHSKRDEEMMREVTFDSSLQNRLVSYYSPTLYKAVGSVLSLFYKPRATPLADEFVLETAARTDAAPFSLLSRMHEKAAPQDGKEDGGRGMMEAIDIAAEGLDHMVAGIDTTGDALCFLMWELSQPRSLAFQRRLQAELRASSNSNEAQLPFDKLPFLDAVVTEGLRCFPAIPMSLPRYVPPGGRTIDGFFLPGGTTVSCQAYSTQRLDEAVFPHPDRFDPDRWLAPQGDSERRHLFFAFSNGGRGCIGKHLALVEMKLLLRDVYSTFTTTPGESMTEESMEMSDQLISSRPRGQRCLLKFSPIEEGEIMA